MLPAGTITRIDRSTRRAYVASSKHEIKSAPKFDKDAYRDPGYRDSWASTTAGFATGRRPIAPRDPPPVGRRRSLP
jgi:hypothetical protein